MRKKNKKYSTLALYGGKKLINRKFQNYNSIGLAEKKAVEAVVRSGKLSSFLGTYSKDFYGGQKVKEFEKKWSKLFKVKYAISVNSWTSGLIAAIGSLNINPGDEIIVSPWTMCATATCILHWNAIPVFADINLEDYCLDPKSVEDLQNTIANLQLEDSRRAFIITDHAYRELIQISDKLGLLADKHFVKQGPVREVIEDEVSRKVYFSSSFI